MKTVLIFTAILLGSNASPAVDRSAQTCRIAQLLPGGIPNAGIDLGSGDSSVPQSPDPLKLENVTLTLQEESVSGTYSLRNGVITGLSTLTHDFSFNPITRRLDVNATLEKGTLTGDYEIIDGRANLTAIGAHRFHGAGPLLGSITEVVVSSGFKLEMHPETQYLSIEDLKIDFDFKNASIVAENLIVNGDKINWEVVNQIIKPMFDIVWGGNKDRYTHFIEERINSLLEGCTLMDLLQLLKPKPPQ